MRKNQATLRQAVETQGVGLFTGAPARARLKPAPPGTGILFVRTDLPERPRLPVNPETVHVKLRRTAVAVENAEVETIEHLLSSLGSVGVDNVEIEIDGPEVPGLDGSGRPWVELLRRAGLEEQTEPRRLWTIREPVAVTEGESSVVACPSENGLTVSYTMDYSGTPLGRQHLTLPVDDASYEREIAGARTFCLQSEAEAFRQQGMGLGASTANTLVVGPEGVIDNTLRYPDEFVRHKILDLLGDLAVLGGVLRAHVVAVKSGHSTNIKLVRRIASVLADRPSEVRRQSLLDVRELNKILPHRYPFLLIDRVIEMDAYRRAVGIKNVTINEPYFQGHFPGQPIMPGVLQIEAMAQLAGALLLRRAENQKKIAVLLSLDGVRFRKTVIPGDQLRIEAETIKIKARTGEIHTRATVDGQLVVEATMKFMIADQE